MMIHNCSGKEYSHNGIVYIQLRKEDKLFILQMCNEDNRFGYHMVKAFNAVLNDIELELENPSSNTPIKSSALITVGKDKFYSNGLNLAEFFGSNTSSSSKQESIVGLVNFLDSEFLILLGRLLVFPIPTVALINGHCYAGGLLLALAHDYRVGQNEYGFYCMNEIKIGLPIHPAMMALLHAKIDKQKVIRDALLTAKRWTAEEALKDDIIDFIVPLQKLLSGGIEYTRGLILNEYGGSNYSSLKKSLYSDAYTQLKGLAKRPKFTFKL